MATQADRAGNPVARQGAMDAHAVYDMSTVEHSVDANKKHGSAYTGGTDLINYEIAEREMVFAYHGPQRGRANGRDTRLAVLSKLNGLGVEASQAYPDDLEMVQLVVRSQIRFVGVSVKGAKPVAGRYEVGLATALAGLNTLPQGNTKGAAYIVAGDIVVADLAFPNDDGRKQPARRSEPGIPDSAFRLQARPLEPRTPARRLHKHVITIITDPQRWRAAMDPQNARLSMVRAKWFSAAKNVIDFVLLGAAIAMGVARDSGEIAPAAGSLLAKALTRAPYAPATAGAGGPSAGAQLTAAYCDLLGVVNADTARSALSEDERRRARRLRHNIAAFALHDGVNPLYEYAYFDRLPGPRDATGKRPAIKRTDAARYPGNGGAVKADVYGQVLEAQLNGFTRAATAVNTALPDEHRFIIGKASTTVLRNGSGRFHVALGINR